MAPNAGLVALLLALAAAGCGQDLKRAPGDPESSPAAAPQTATEVAGLCDILDSPERRELSAAGEMLLLEHCGRREAPAFETRQGEVFSGPDLPDLPEPRPPSIRPAGSPLSSIAVVAADVQINVDPGPPRTTQSETTLAVLNGVLVAGWNDSGGPGLSGYGVSTDLGDTWADRGGLPSIVNVITGRRGDPWIRAHAATGNFHYATLATDPNVQCDDDGDGFPENKPILGVYTGATPGAAPDWPAAANVTPGQPCGTFEDKEAMDVDNSGGPFDGRVYVCWRQFGGQNTIRLSINDSTGADSALTNVSISNINGAAGGGQGCYVEVDQNNGDVWVAWQEGLLIRGRRSAAGGAGFGPERTLATMAAVGHVVDCDSGADVDNRQVMNGNIRVSEFISSMAVNQVTGNLHVVYASDGDGAGGADEGDAWHVRCPPLDANDIDTGACTAPLKLNTDATTNDQWHPFVDAAAAGPLAVFWYDRRNDPDNRLIDLYKRFSTDDGDTWTAEERVTDVAFDVPVLIPNFDPGIRDCYMGEYNHVASDSSNFYFVWGDNRNLLAGLPDPDVFFEREPIPGVPQCDANGPYVVECSGGVGVINLDGSGSFDPEGGALTYSWTTDCGGGAFDDATSATPTLTADGPPPCPVGCTVTLVVEDEDGLSDTCSAEVTVQDTTPPALVVPPLLLLECSEPGGVSAANPAIQAWLALAAAADGCGSSALADDAPVFFPAGCPPAGEITVVTFTATDECGNATVGVSSVTVVDSLPPVIDVQPALGPAGCAFLWPPSHGYADFDLSDTGIVAHDVCDGVTLDFSSCLSSQPEDGTGLGDGSSTRDCVISPDGELLSTRAERSGSCGPIDRSYTMTIDATDDCGNTNESDPFGLGVYHDQGHQPPPTGPVYSANSDSDQDDTRSGSSGAYGVSCGPGYDPVCDPTQTLP